MKLKFYLRGLGIGIFVTALVMKIASSNNGAMTDDEIMQRAAELGMVTPKTLVSQAQDEGGMETAEATAAPTEEPVSTQEPDLSTAEPEPVATPTKEPETVPTEEPTAEPTEEPTEAPASEPVDGEKVTLTIYSGEHSATVAKRMEELGLVEDYLDFDDYLCDNGYSRYVNSGVYKIKPGLSYEELAKIITRTN